MTIEQIWPCRKRLAYRSREDGDYATVVAFNSEQQMVKLETAMGPRVMTAEAFWNAWIHRDLYDPARN